MTHPLHAAVIHSARASAANLPSMGATKWVNLWRTPHGIQVEAYDTLDAAADDAASPSIYTYLGTVPADDLLRLDLRAHGDAIGREAIEDAQTENRHRLGLMSGAGRAVL